MGIGISIFFIAAGATLAFAVTQTVNGIDLVTVGVILMIVGGIGLLVSLAMLDTFRRSRVVREDHVIVPTDRYVP